MSAKKGPSLKPRWLSRQEAARYLTCSTWAFDKHVRPFLSIPSSIGSDDRYDCEDIDRVMESRILPDPLADE